MSSADNKIGRYTIKQHLGKGGMGEVLLVIDPLSEREVALKMIRKDLQNHRSVQAKFLNEARITSRLSHPSIIPVYEIHKDDSLIYYTMPYIEGKTLNQILDPTKEESPHSLRDSIPALMGIFLQICQGIAYTHSKQIFHRDLKPENILIGKYGEVLIFDWGIAETKEQQKEKPLHPPPKVAGTLNYMSPERAFGEKASPLTEIYSLGAILYKILTLHSPFHRKSLFQFRRLFAKEQLLDPSEVAPYREIPHKLSSIVKKCLAPAQERYPDVQSLLEDVKSYIEGRSEWHLLEHLSTSRSSDWQFQENILLAKHIAISTQIDISEWVGIMVSKHSFSGNIAIDATLSLEEESHGIGFLLDLPSPTEGRILEEGYCLWLGSPKTPSSQLFRSNILVLDLGPLHLPLNKPQKIRLEKVQNHLYCYLNGKLLFSYTSHLPLAGDHIGILHRDDRFVLHDMQIFGGSHNVMINCLALPDAFLARKDYETALIEYRKIGHSFPGRAEGREALFRAGLTLLEQAKSSSTNKEALFQQALDEFENLEHTSGAPLEYLGKSLVYKDLQDATEETKCLELALRKYPKHPLLPLLEEQITYRLHQSSLEDKKACYQLLLLVLLHLPKIAKMEETHKLITSLKKNWEDLPFIQKIDEEDLDQELLLIIQLCFWLSKDKALLELYSKLSQDTSFAKSLRHTLLFTLFEMGYRLIPLELLKEEDPFFHLLREAIVCDQTCEEEKNLSSIHFQPLFSLLAHSQTLSFQELQFLYHLLQKAIDAQFPLETLPLLHTLSLPKDHLVTIYCIWSYLLDNRIEEAGKLLHHYDEQKLKQENSPLYFLYGCYLLCLKKEQPANHHLLSALPTANPHSCTLLSHFLQGRLDENWWKQAFFYEKRALYRELTLYYHCKGDIEKKEHYRKLSRRSCDDEEP